MKREQKWFVRQPVAARPFAKRRKRVGRAQKQAAAFPPACFGRRRQRQVFGCLKIAGCRRIGLRQPTGKMRLWRSSDYSLKLKSNSLKCQPKRQHIRTQTQVCTDMAVCFLNFSAKRFSDGLILIDRPSENPVSENLTAHGNGFERTDFGKIDGNSGRGCRRGGEF